MSEEPPEEPCILDSRNKVRYYWIHQSMGMMKDEVIREENKIMRKIC